MGWCIKSAAAGLERYDLAQHALYNTLESQYGVQIARAEETLEAVAASRRAAQFLAVKTGWPLLTVTRAVYAEDNRVILSC